MSIKLSITIVAYNNYSDIENTIRSLGEVTSPNIDKHVYIVDNGAAETNTRRINEFKQFIAKYCDVEYIDTGANIGFGRGHNFVLPLLDSEYHAIVNPDILFYEDAFSKILIYMDNNLDVGMCIPNIVDERGERQLVYREELSIFDMFIRMFCKKLFPKRVAKHTLQSEDYSKPFQVPFGQGSFLVIRTSLFKKLDGFDDKYFMYLEDADLCKRVNQESKLMYYPDANVVHKWEQGSHKSKILFKYHVESMKYYFKKWGWKFI